MSVFMAMIAGRKTEVVARCSLALENVALCVGQARFQ